MPTGPQFNVCHPNQIDAGLTIGRRSSVRRTTPLASNTLALPEIELQSCSKHSAVVGGASRLDGSR